MASRQGQLARQLTQWVGGTIITLMFIFILVDYGIQHKYFQRQQQDLATSGAEGLRTLLESRSLDDAKAELATAINVAGFIESQQHALAIFDLSGNTMFNSPGALSNNPDEMAILKQPPVGNAIEVRSLTVGGERAMAAIAAFETREDTPVRGYAAFLLKIEPYQQMALRLWSLRSVIVLVIIIGVMVAVRIPVKRFVVKPIDGLFLAAYAASKDDFQELPACPVDNEFTELYEMFDRLMGHLSDTRVPEEGAAEGKPEEGQEEELL